VFLVIFAGDIVGLVFFRDAFGEEAVLLTSRTLRGIAFGLWAATLAWILIRILNGAGRNAQAALIIVSAYAVNIAVNLLCSHMQIAGGSGMLLLGLGEAARSILLLAAVVFVLEGRRKILLLIVLALLPASLMALFGWQIYGAFDGTIERMAAGVLANLLCLAFAVGLLMLWAYVSMLGRVRRNFGMKGDQP
jgi:putative peptidoglycan lipid II flippase